MSSDPTPTLPASLVLAGGQASLPTGATFTRAGVQTLTAFDVAGALSQGSTSAAVVAGAATHLRVSDTTSPAPRQQPASFRVTAPEEMGENLPYVSLGTGRTALQVTGASRVTNCALLDDRAIKCWGNNNQAQLGLGDTMTRGTGANQMGDALPTVNLGTGRRALSIGATGFASCAVLDDGQAKCWGHNSNTFVYEPGLLGLGDSLDRGGSPAHMGDALPAVQW